MRFDTRLLLAAASIAFVATPAWAQATRTWVSGVGDDVNPCSRTAPCKTFAGAIGKTAAGGEINCIDAGGYGSVTINKSMSIVCDQTEGGILHSGANGILVNIGANDVVYIRGVEFNGGVGNTLAGIRIISGGTVILEDVLFRNNANAIQFVPTGAAKLTVIDATISNSSAAGIQLAPAVPLGTVSSVTLRQVRVVANGNATASTGGGILVDSKSALNFAMSKSAVSGNLVYGIRFTPGGAVDAAIEDSTIDNNGANGIEVLAASSGVGNGANLAVTSSEIAGNGAIGIQFTPSAGSTLALLDTSVANNGVGSTGGGINVQPANGGANIITLKTTRVVSNANSGLNIVSTAGTVSGSVDNSTFNANGSYGVQVSSASNSTRLLITNSTIAYNKLTGVLSTGANLVTGLGNTSVTGNQNGISSTGQNPGMGILSFKNNYLSNNPSGDGSFNGQINQQ